MPLNGPDGVEAWPFPGPVHVITGWNPQGVSLGEQSHEDVNHRIASDILRLGGRFVHGAGRSTDSAQSEPSLIAWGLDRAIALRLGRQAMQDSIFEIDADNVHLLSCIDDRVSTWPRHG